MANNLFGNLPAFTAGQVLSASAHLNTLQNHISLAYGDIVGVSTPCLGTTSYAIRHQWNRLRYSVYIYSGAIVVKYNSATVGTISGSGAVTGYFTLTGLTVDSFYTITLTASGGGTFDVYAIYEEQTTGYPTLASFANNTVPTAADWQGLVDYAAAVEAALDVPQPTGSRLNYQLESPYANTKSAAWYMIHRGRYLTLSYRVWAPYSCETGSNWIRVRFWIDGVEIHAVEYTSAQSVQVTIDLFDLGFTSLGSGMVLSMVVNQNSTCDNGGQFWLDSIYETPYIGDAVAGWTPFVNWSHADWVWGSNPTGTALKLQTIKGNLQTIAATILEIAQPSPERSHAFLYGIRRRRFLHYKTYSGEQCSINWNYNDDQQVVLPEASSTFLSVDLDTLVGLFPGTAYWIGGTRFAIEDSHA